MELIYIFNINVFAINAIISNTLSFIRYALKIKQKRNFNRYELAQLLVIKGIHNFNVLNIIV